MKIRIKPYHKRQDGWILAALGLVLSAVGTGLSMKGQADAQAAQDDERSQELYRQSQYQKKAAEVVNKQISESSAENQKPQIDAAAAKRADEYNRITSTIKPAPSIAVSRTVSAPMAQQSAQQSAISAAWNKIIGGAQAKQGAFGDWGLARNIAQQRASQDIATIGVDARRSAEISGMEQQDASRAGDGTKAAGTLLGLAGQGVGAYASTQSSGWGSAPEGTTTDGYYSYAPGTRPYAT